MPSQRNASSISTPSKRMRPASYKSKKYAKKRVPRSMSIPNIGVGFPDKIKVTHRYVDNFAMAQSAGLKAKYNIRCNGLFDPNTTGIGHQPAWFDTMKEIYDHYYIVASRIKITMVPQPSVTAALLCNVFINDDTADAAGNILANAENSTAKNKVSCTVPGAPTILYSSYSHAKVYGGSLLSDDNQRGTRATDPDEESFYTITTQPLDFNSAWQAFYMVEVEYDAIWVERKDFAEN